METLLPREKRDRTGTVERRGGGSPLTRPEALLDLGKLTAGLPPGTVEERASKAAERLAAQGEADVLRSLLLELALRHLMQAGGVDAGC
jgi:hypothetical protein